MSRLRDRIRKPCTSHRAKQLPVLLGVGGLSPRLAHPKRMANKAARQLAAERAEYAKMLAEMQQVPM
jgi:hypothetical protein